MIKTRKLSCTVLKAQKNEIYACKHAKRCLVTFAGAHEEPRGYNLERLAIYYEWLKKNCSRYTETLALIETTVKETKDMGVIIPPDVLRLMEKKYWETWAKNVLDKAKNKAK